MSRSEAFDDSLSHMWFPLRLKFFLFATLLAVAPLAIVGQNLTQMTRDELKSAANEDLTAVAAQLRTQFDNQFQGRWLSPLMVIRNGIDSEELGVPQKASLLTLGLQELPGVVALQLAIDGSKLPIMATDQTYSQRLEAAGLDPVAALTTAPEMLSKIAATGQFGRPLIRQDTTTGDWLATLALPLKTTIAGRGVTLAAKIELSSLTELVQRHPFAQRGEITVIDQTGRSVLGTDQTLLIERSIVQDALPLIVAEARADTLQTYTRPDGTLMLGAYTFPDWFPWAIVTEISEERAYGVVNAITEQILIVGIIGFVIASIGALVFARRLTRPILDIGETAEAVGAGDLNARVRDLQRNDEIGQLAQRFNTMIGELSERLELMKFVSAGTMSAIQEASGGMARGGTRQRISVIFTDIRGYTEFSEAHPPETVIEALNAYFDVQARIVVARGGDIDKFIGDALVAVWLDEDMEKRAALCCVEIAEAMQGMLEKYPEYNLHVGIGIASGEAVMGAVGAEGRMDFTVLGSTVNRAARLCAKADPGEVLTDEATRTGGEQTGIRFDALAPIELKGYAEPVPAYSARRC